jgi:maltose operon protein
MRKNPGRAAVFVMALSLAAGCATPRESALESFAAAPSCCRAMGEFRFEPLNAGDTVRFDLAAGSPAFVFDTGKSYFRAFALPGARGYTVRVQSYMMGDQIDKAYLFFPHVVTLDDRYRVVRTMAPDAFELRKAGFAEIARETWGLPWKLEGALRFDAGNAGERYLVVLTTDALLARSTSTETLRIMPIILPGIVTAIPTHKERVAVPHAPSGHLSVSVTD